MTDSHRSRLPLAPGAPPGTTVSVEGTVEYWPHAADGLTGRITHHCETWAQHDAESIIREAEGKLRLPHSGRKLTRMLRDLEAEGFTSFT